MKHTIAALFFITALAADALPSRAQTTGPCPSAAYVTLESGRIAAIDWVQAGSTVVHTRSEITQSAVIDASIDVASDQSTTRTVASFTMAGSPSGTPVERRPGPGSVYWSDMVASSVQQAVARARALGAQTSHIAATSLFSKAVGTIDVQRIDDTDFSIAYHHKRYDVFTDTRGCVLAASLPDFGVTIERRFDVSAAAYALWAPYAAPPDRAYASAGVAIPSASGVVLAGTLTTPPKSARGAAAILITGLSQHERNNGAPPWMPLRDLADALTRAGITVLRVDDRGIGRSTGDPSTYTTFTKADDVRAEIRWLRTQPGVDPRRIFLVGYSEGGLIAPMVASTDRSIAGIVTLSGPGVPGDVVARYQTAERVDNDPSIAPADRAAQIRAQLAEPLDAHERSFVAIDPLVYAKHVRCPALIVQGATDVTVPVRSAERLAQTMRAAGNADVTVRLFPNISHALLPDTFGLDSEWVKLPAFLTSPGILDLVAGWVQRKAAGSPAG